MLAQVCVSNIYSSVHLATEHTYLLIAWLVKQEIYY